MEYKIVKIAIWFICIEDKDKVGVHRLIIFIYFHNYTIFKITVILFILFINI